jgi:predicted membrane protein
MNSVFAGSNVLVRGIILFLLLGTVIGFVYWGTTRSGKILTENLTEPLNGITNAKVDINTREGNLSIDPLSAGDQILARGTLQYSEKQGLPTQTLDSSSSQVIFSVKGNNNERHSFRLPWATKNDAIKWQIYLNPVVFSDITAHTGGGNVNLDLTGTVVNSVRTDIGGGNIDMILPNNTANLSVTAKTGAGNVTIEIGNGITGISSINATSGAGKVAIHVPGGIATKIHATSGMGKVTLDPRFVKIDSNTYQSPDYDSAVNKIEIAINSGAGDVTVTTR